MSTSAALERLKPPLVVVRSRPLQPLLRRKAMAAHMEPEELVAQAIAQTPSFDAAAQQLGVTTNTLRAWRRRLDIQILDREAMDE